MIKPGDTVKVVCSKSNFKGVQAQVVRVLPVQGQTACNLELDYFIGDKLIQVGEYQVNEVNNELL